MTKHLREALGLPMLEDALREVGAFDSDVVSEEIDEEEVEEAEEDKAIPNPNVIKRFDEVQATLQRLSEAGGEDHQKAMDLIHRETLDRARDLFDLAMNTELPRQRGIFEQSANFYKLAIDSKDTKRLRQLDTLKVALAQQKLEMEKLRVKGSSGEPEENNGVFMVEDRNEVIRRARAQIASSKS